MYGVKPYYLSSSGTLDYTEGYTISVNTSTSQFNVLVPLASSIESTMEWCDRVGERHHWIDLNNNLFDVSGFKWLHYDGNRQLNRVVPSSAAPYYITGDNLLGSGFYLRYREIVKFMGENNLSDYGFPDGYNWPNMEYGGNGRWKPIEDLNPASGNAKLDYGHYHEYIYRGAATAPFWWGGVFYKTSYVDTPGGSVDPVIGENTAWNIAPSSHMTSVQTMLNNWSGLTYEYINGLPLSYNTYIAKGGHLHNWGTPVPFSGLYLPPPSSINTYFNFITYPDVRQPFLHDQEVYGNRIIGFSHTKGSIRKVYWPYVYASSDPPITTYFYNRQSGVYGSQSTQLLNNGFWAELYPLNHNVFDGSFAQAINKKLIHLLGNSGLSYVGSNSGIFSGLPMNQDGVFYGFRQGIRLVDGLPFGMLLPTWDSKTHYECGDDWTGSFKLACGFIQMSGSRLITGRSVTYTGGDYNESTIIGNKVASKLRNNQYQELFSFIPAYPSGSNLGTFHTTPSSINTDVTSMSNIYSNGDNVIFLAMFYTPFEGLGSIDTSLYYENPPPNTLPSYSVPAANPYLDFALYEDNIITKRRRKGQLIQITVPSAATVPSSILLTDTGRLQHNMTWW